MPSEHEKVNVVCLSAGSEAQTRDCYAESSCSGVVQQMNSNFQQCCLETSIGLAVRIDEQCEPCLGK